MARNEIKINIDRKRFNKFSVLETHHHKKGNRWKCKCVCDCGNEFFPDLAGVLRGSTKSCGCDRYTHETKLNGIQIRLNRIWCNMKERCNNPKRKDYYLYGGRGIRVCDMWLENFKSFKSWALANGYDDNLTLDRIDGNGNYCPENCRWATTKEQNANRRTNRLIKYNGKTMPLSYWAKEFGLSSEGMRYRLDVMKLSINQAFRQKEGRRIKLANV